MDLRTLGRTDLEVSRLSMGAMTFGGQTEERDAARMVSYCLDAGVNFFDTANVYNQGRSEEILGRALKGVRNKVVVASKVFGRLGDGPDDAGLSGAAIRKAIDASLRRLGTDYLDLYYLHQPDWTHRIEDTLEAMDSLVRSGKVRYPAVSNYASWQVVQMLWQSERQGYLPPTVSQQMYNLLARGIEQEYLSFCREFGVGLICYNPLAGGLLSGKHSQGSAPAAGSRFDGNQAYLDRYWQPEFFEAVKRLTSVAKEAGLSLPSLAFRWLLSRPEVDSVIIGASRMEHLVGNIEAGAGPPLASDIMEKCDSVWKRLRGVTPIYNR